MHLMRTNQEEHSDKSIESSFTLFGVILVSFFRREGFKFVNLEQRNLSKFLLSDCCQ